MLERRYGAGTFIAVFDSAVIDWGPNEEEVRARAEKAVGEPIFVTAVSSDPEPEDYHERPDYERLERARKGRKFRRRVSMWGVYNSARTRTETGA